MLQFANISRREKSYTSTLEHQNQLAAALPWHWGRALHAEQQHPLLNLC
jgi:hypothetical protein